MILAKLTLEENLIWDEEVYPAFLQGMLTKFGRGPFKVVGLRLCERIASVGDCPYAVTIQLANNTRHEFPGEWFVRA